MTEVCLELPQGPYTDLQLEQLPQIILLRAAKELYRAEKLSSQQAATLAGVTYEQFLQDLGESILEAPETQLTPMDSLLGSKYLARVLWALRESHRRSLPAMTAADIAKFVCANSEVSIETTNTARFFRECRESGRFEAYWRTLEDGPRRQYEISLEGQELLDSGEGD